MVDPDWQHTGEPRYQPPSPPSGPLSGTSPSWPPSDSVGGSALPPPPPSAPSPQPVIKWQRQVEGGDELVDLAYEAAKARLASQTSAFESLRTRASGILGVATLVTSFSAGLGLINVDPTTGRLLPAWAPWTLMGLLLAVGWCAFVILLPTRQWSHGPSARIIMEKWAGGAAERDALVFLTGAMVDAQLQNSTELGRRAWAYRVAVLLLLAQVLTLVAAIFQS